MEQNEQQVNQQPVNEQQASRHSRGAIYLLIVVVLVIIVLVATSKNTKDKAAIETPTGEQTTMCFYAANPTPSGLSDVYALKLDVSGASAKGELSTIPAEKDKMTGTLSGVVVQSGQDTIFNGRYNNSAEGMQNVEQRIIKLSTMEARIGYGEMVQNPDGTYSYKDSNTLDYSLAIPRVDCAQYQSAS